MVNLGATANNITAVIGPSISQRAYEVGPEFFEDFLAEDPDYARYFAQGEADRMQFDLPGFGLNRLAGPRASAMPNGHGTVLIVIPTGFIPTGAPPTQKKRTTGA